MDRNIEHVTYLCCEPTPCGNCWGLALRQAKVLQLTTTIDLSLSHLQCVAGSSDMDEAPMLLVPLKRSMSLLLQECNLVHKLPMTRRHNPIWQCKALDQPEYATPMCCTTASHNAFTRQCCNPCRRTVADRPWSRLSCKAA